MRQTQRCNARGCIMIGLAFAAILGFKAGAGFHSSSLFLGGIMGATASTVSFILGNDVVQNYPHLIPAFF